MTEPRCATCAFWRANVDHHDDLSVMDPETLEPLDPQPFEVRRCVSPKLRRYERPEIDGAATMDGSHYWSALMTGPQFGCIHHSTEAA